MAKIYSTERIRQLEKEWADSHQGSTWDLMLSAAQSFVHQFKEILLGQSVLVVVGRGNNGGDGYAIASLLVKLNVEVIVWQALGEPKDGTDAHEAKAQFLSANGSVSVEKPEKTFGVIVDALFGIGLARELDKPIEDIIKLINSAESLILAVDIPSGLNAETGQPMIVSVKANYTHSFIGLKPGMLTAEGPALCGVLSCDPIGLDAQTEMNYSPHIIEIPQRFGNTHKTDHGDLRVFGGTKGMGGAAIIAARSALNIGAGRVTLHCHESYQASVVSQYSEIMTAELFNNVVEANPELDYQLTFPFDVNKTTCVVGPGLGTTTEAINLVNALIETNKGVLDADALRILAGNPRSIPSWVLTPHAGEAAALLGVTSTEVQKNRLKAVKALVAKYDTTVVLKGAGTIVANAEHIVFCHPGHPKMATAGMGDCLAGIIGALMAQGLDLLSAAVSGVNLHAQIGLELAKDQNVVLATDIIEKLKFKHQLPY